MNMYFYCALLWGMCAALNTATMITRQSPLHLILVMLNITCCILYCIMGINS